MAFQVIGKLHQDSHAAGAVVGAQDRHLLARGIRLVVRGGSGIPVREQEYAVARLRPEARDHVGEGQGLAGGGVGGGELLQHDGVGALLQVLDHPVELLLVPRRARDPWSEGNLLLQQVIGSVLVEGRSGRDHGGAAVAVCGSAPIGALAADEGE
jgi:hypothetical protein